MSLLEEEVRKRRRPAKGAHATLGVQLVVYGHGYRRLLPTVRSIVASARHAQERAAIGDYAVVIGDCSSRPSLEEQELSAFERLVGDAGGEFGYTFFAANLGSAGGSNRLAAAHDAELALVLNPDTYLHPHALAELVDAMTDSVGIAEGRQLPLEHPKDHDPITGETSWASGACMLVRRTAWNDAGGFDTDHFFLHCDDVDFSWRVRAKGWRVVHVPSALVQHDKRLTLEGKVKSPAVEVFHGTLGRLMLLTRYNRPELLERTIEHITKRGNDHQLRALREFERRRDAARVPDPLDAETTDQVACFTAGNYATHRF